MRKIKEIILHCADTIPHEKYTTEDIKEWHLQRGFNDIGYHFVIEVDGAIKTGRSIEISGAHCKGFNKNSIGICLIGGKKDSNGESFKEVQFDSLSKLLKDLFIQYPSIKHIKGHNDYSSNKTCPVFDVKHFLDKYGFNNE